MFCLEAGSPTGRADSKVVPPMATQKVDKPSPVTMDAGVPLWEEEDDEDDEEDDEKTPDLSWIDLPWTEMENVEWSEKECCRVTPAATPNGSGSWDAPWKSRGEDGSTCGYPGVRWSAPNGGRNWGTPLEE
jgi:hypothetical protein